MMVESYKQPKLPCLLVSNTAGSVVHYKRASGQTGCIITTVSTARRGASLSTHERDTVMMMKLILLGMALALAGR